MLLMVFSVAAFAGSRRVVSHLGQASGPLTGSSVFEAVPSVIHSITLVADAGDATVSIFDSAISEAGSPIYELKAKSGTTQVLNLCSAPARTDNGIAVTTTNGTAFLDYE